MICLSVIQALLLGRLVLPFFLLSFQLSCSHFVCCIDSLVITVLFVLVAIVGYCVSNSVVIFFFCTVVDSADRVSRLRL